MMKISLILIFLMLTMSKVASQGFVIHGEISKSHNQTVYLELNRMVIDSTMSYNDKFTFTGGGDIPRFASITILANQFDFIIENSIISIQGNIDTMWKSKLTGSYLTDRWNDYDNQYLSPVRTKAVNNTILANELLSKGDSIGADRLYSESGRLVQESRNDSKKFLINRDDLFGLFLLNDFKNEFDTTEINYMLDGRYKKFSATPLYKSIHNYVDNEKILKIGKAMIGFSFKDTLGKALKIEDFKGKYVLIDFWASWCGICRNETPLLKKVYKAYHQKNFEIIAISIDSDREKWVKALRQDAPTWLNAIDEKKGVRVSELLNVYAVPANFLIDTNGIIIAKDIHGDDLEFFLSSLFKN